MALKWMNNRTLALLVLVFTLCAASPVHAESLENIQRFYMKHRDFTVSFTQDTHQSLVEKDIRFIGTVSYLRDVGVRMDVTEPERQVIILEGQTVTVHLPAQDTTTVQALPPEMASQNILGFFSGLDTIGEGYEVQETPEALYLYPREGSGHITVWTDDSHAIRRILLRDAAGNRSDIRLSDYRFDVGLSAKLFELKAESDS
jgi:outer membrane lipoprotein-sorting protein